MGTQKDGTAHSFTHGDASLDVRILDIPGINKLRCFSSWTWGRTSSLWGWWSPGPGCPGRLWSLLLWRYSRPFWTRSYSVCCRWPCFGRRVGLDDPQRSLPTPTILWFCDSVILWFCLPVNFCFSFRRSTAATGIWRGPVLREGWSLPWRQMGHSLWWFLQSGQWQCCMQTTWLWWSCYGLGMVLLWPWQWRHPAGWREV